MRSLFRHAAHPAFAGDTLDQLNDVSRQRLPCCVATLSTKTLAGLDRLDALRERHNAFLSRLRGRPDATHTLMSCMGVYILAL